MSRTAQPAQLQLDFNPEPEPDFRAETLSEALEWTFPADPLSDEVLEREFRRLFPD